MDVLLDNNNVFINNNNIDGPEAQPNKPRRKKSIVWEHFTIEIISSDVTRACCKQCKKSFAYITGSKLAGTSHLKRHIALGICPVARRSQENNQRTPYTPGSQNGVPANGARKRYRATPVSIPFDQQLCNQEIARMIILHDHPLHMVEHSGFIDFSRTLQPQFSKASFDAIHDEIMGIYLKEKQNLENVFGGIAGRVSLTMDFWTSDQTLGYAILTGHFVDTDWKLHHRILNVVLVPFPDSEVAFNHALVSCLCNWSLESKLFTLTLDQSFANESIVANLRGLLSIRNPHILNGQFLIANCYARVITRLAQEALGAMSETVVQVREIVKYVKTSQSQEQKFNELRRQLQVPSTKSLVLDNQYKWDSTHRMLSSACELKEVFSCLDTPDPHYKGPPSFEQWKHLETLCSYLSLFSDAIGILTEATYPTTNKFFPEICKLYLELTHGAMSGDLFVSNLIRPLYEKFNSYWNECSLIVAMAVVMDPRYKLKLVEYTFCKIYGEDAVHWVRAVENSIHELFLEYIAQTLPLPLIHVEQRHDSIIKTENPQDEEASLHSIEGLSDFDIYISEISSNQQVKSELYQYLEECLSPSDEQDFDVLEWWKHNRIKYPTLSKMAADVLSIPVATVSKDAVFDTRLRKLNSDECNLRPKTLEAVVCTKNWLQLGFGK